MTSENGKSLAMTKVEVLERNKERAEQLRVECKNLIFRMEETYVELAEKLYEINAHRLYRFYQDANGETYKSFEEWVEKELSMAARKGFYLTNIYKRLVVDLGVPKEQLKAVSFSKAREFAGVVETAKDAETWIEKSKSMNYAEVLEEVRDQKGRKNAKQKGVEGSIHRWCFLMRDDQHENLQQALEHARGQAEPQTPDANNHLLDLICTAYLANEALTGDLDDPGLKRVLKGLERVYKIAILAVKENDEILYGSKKILKKMQVD
jgi:hypothetical protein